MEASTSVGSVFMNFYVVVAVGVRGPCLKNVAVEGHLVDMISLLAVATVAHAALLPALDVNTKETHTMFGLYQLPVRSLPEDSCTDLGDLCKLQDKGHFVTYFEGLEARLDTCGLDGWSKIGYLGAGRAVTVALRETPCGLKVACHGTHNLHTVTHIQTDCYFQRLLSKHENSPCPSCFPKVYYESNKTGMCYNEYIPSQSLSNYLDHFNVTTDSSPKGLKIVKELFSQGLLALKALISLGVRHNDLGIRNMLVRLDQPDMQLVLIDFGASVLMRSHQSANGDRISDTNSDNIKAGVASFSRQVRQRRLTGNGGHHDAFVLACDWWRYIRMPEALVHANVAPCESAVETWRNTTSQSASEARANAEGTFEGLLVDMMQAASTRAPLSEESLQKFRRDVADVRRLFL